MRTGTDGAGGISKRQTAREIGRGRLTQRLPNHRGGFCAVMAQEFAQCDLDGEDHQLHHLDGVLAGLVGVVNRIIEDQFEYRVATLVLNQAVHLVDPVGEDVVAKIQTLAHLPVLGAEAGQHPDRPIGDRPVSAVHQWTGLAVCDRTKALDSLIVVAGHDDRTGTTVISSRQRTAD